MLKNKILIFCMIKNESKIIQKFISENSRLTKYFYFLDTGSTDDTISRIKKYSTLDKNVKIFTHETIFRNFIETRNEGIELFINDPEVVKEKFDYVCFMDSDEFFLNENVDNTLEFLEKLDEENINKKKVVIHTGIHHYGSEYDRIRFVAFDVLKNDNMRYRGPGVHEYLSWDSSDRVDVKIPKTISMVEHIPGPCKNYKDRLLGYTTILKEFVDKHAEGDPDFSRGMYYLGNTYYDIVLSCNPTNSTEDEIEDYRELCRNYYRKYLNIKGNNFLGEKTDAVIKLSRSFPRTFDGGSYGKKLLLNKFFNDVSFAKRLDLLVEAMKFPMTLKEENRFYKILVDRGIDFLNYIENNNVLWYDDESCVQQIFLNSYNYFLQRRNFRYFKKCIDNINLVFTDRTYISVLNLLSKKDKINQLNSHLEYFNFHKNFLREKEEISKNKYNRNNKGISPVRFRILSLLDSGFGAFFKNGKDNPKLELNDGFFGTEMSYVNLFNALLDYNDNGKSFRKFDISIQVICQFPDEQKNVPYRILELPIEDRKEPNKIVFFNVNFVKNSTTFLIDNPDYIIVSRCSDDFYRKEWKTILKDTLKFNNIDNIGKILWTHDIYPGKLEQFRSIGKDWNVVVSTNYHAKMLEDVLNDNIQCNVIPLGIDKKEIKEKITFKEIGDTINFISPSDSIRFVKPLEKIWTILTKKFEKIGKKIHFDCFRINSIPEGSHYRDFLLNTENITVNPVVPHDEIFNKMKEADGSIYLTSSFGETFCLSKYEAELLGIPFFTTDWAALGENKISEDFYFDLDEDVEYITDKIVEYYSKSSVELNEIKKKRIESIDKLTYTWEEIVNKYWINFLFGIRL